MNKVQPGFRDLFPAGGTTFPPAPLRPTRIGFEIRVLSGSGRCTQQLVHFVGVLSVHPSQSRAATRDGSRAAVHHVLVPEVTRTGVRRVLDDLERRIDDTRRWCHKVGDVSHPRSSLRSAALLSSLAWNDADAIRQGSLRDIDLRRAAHAVSFRRASAVASAAQFSHTSGVGSFIVYDRSTSFLCGLASKATRGYFDDEDCPPWDTWICFGRVPGCVDARGDRVSTPILGLLAYVPPCFLELVTRGLAESVGFALYRLEGSPAHVELHD